MKLPKELITVTPLSIALSAVCFIFFVILAFYLGMQYQQVQELTEQQRINIQSIAVTQQKPTSETEKIYRYNPPEGWQTYTSKTNNYSLSFPAGWTKYEGLRSNPNRVEYIELSPNNSSQNPRSDYVYVTIANNTANLTIDEYLQQSLFLKRDTNEIVSIDNTRGIKINDLYERAHSEAVFLAKNGKIYRINLQKEGGTKLPEGTFDKILSTFKFTN